MKPRHQFYLDDTLAQELDRLTQRKGTTKSAIVNAALKAYFAHRGMGELEQAFGKRLDRTSDHLAEIERNQNIVLECIALFVRYQLALLPPLPASELTAGQSVGHDRFQAFLDQVSRRIAGGRSIGADVNDRIARAEKGEEARVAA